MMPGLLEAIDARAARFGLSAADLLWRDAPFVPDRSGQVSANGTCRLLATDGGWAALNLARADDWDVVPGLTHQGSNTWDDLVRAARNISAVEFKDTAVELQLPVALPGEAAAQPLAAASGMAVPGKIVDMSALWAGPLCAGLLAREGADVIRIDSIGRPDPTPVRAPLLDARINAAKRRLALDLRTPEGLAELHAQIDSTEVLVTSARPAALARMGLTQDRFPHLAWVAITAHGFAGSGAGRVGFGDDCAVAGGLVDWQDGEPHFIGDALADPLTGLEAALAVLSGQRGVIDMAMARVAAAYSGLRG